MGVSEQRVREIVREQLLALGQVDWNASRKQKPTHGFSSPSGRVSADVYEPQQNGCALGNFFHRLNDIAGFFGVYGERVSRVVQRVFGHRATPSLSDDTEA